MEKVTYSLKLDKNLRDALEEAARREQRSMASMVKKLLVDYLREQGIPWEEDTKSRGKRKKK